MPTSVSFDFKGTIQIIFYSLRRETLYRIITILIIIIIIIIAIQGAKEESRDLRK
jgi:hypothetical protein